MWSFLFSEEGNWHCFLELQRRIGEELAKNLYYQLQLLVFYTYFSHSPISNVEMLALADYIA